MLDSETFGRCLVLDGKTQSTEVDEHIYHEALVHPALLRDSGPRSVFVGGGGRWRHPEDKFLPITPATKR